MARDGIRTLLPSAEKFTLNRLYRRLVPAGHSGSDGKIPGNTLGIIEWRI